MNKLADKILSRLLDIPTWILDKLLDLANERLEKPCFRTSQGWCTTHRRWESDSIPTLDLE